MRNRVEFQDEGSAWSNVPIVYCGFGTCDYIPDHEGEHVCRCGVRVLDPSPDCQIHITPPKPMTASILQSYLEYTADRYPIEDEPIMYNGEPIVNAYVVDGRVFLQTFKDTLETS